MTVQVETRTGTRRSLGATFYRWKCPHDHAGRWTRQSDTALEGARRHALQCTGPTGEPSTS